MAKFLYYDRLDDGDLELHDIENCINLNVMTYREIMAIFEEELIEATVKGPIVEGKNIEQIRRIG